MLSVRGFEVDLFLRIFDDAEKQSLLDVSEVAVCFDGDGFAPELYRHVVHFLSLAARWVTILGVTSSTGARGRACTAMCNHDR